MVAPLVMMGISAAAGIASKLGDALGGAQSPDPARKTADDFETMFLETTLNRMVESGGAEGPLGDNGTGGIHRSMLADQFAKGIVKSGGIGIADGIYRQMLRMQEAANG